VDTIYDAGSEAPSAAIQHRLQERKEGQPTFHPKKQTKKKKTKNPKTPSNTIIEFARAQKKNHRKRRDLNNSGQRFGKKKTTFSITKNEENSRPLPRL